ncbi:MAG: type II toxin-antitoxin system RelE/ParE family toxin [Bacteroidales bacterium]|nr:type II toxin-antitoxin system RelE/ParE family toxin [Bacteroidales bacterium]
MKSKTNYKVIISDSAKEDIKENARWYNKQQKGLGNRFIQNIKECIKIIQLKPESFQIRYKNMRAGIPDKFPYLIIYNVNKDNKTISIIAVFHSSKNPEKCKSKI